MKNWALLLSVEKMFYLELFESVFRLTDEESKKNWETYGNPDGPGGKYLFHIVLGIGQNFIVDHWFCKTD